MGNPARFWPGASFADTFTIALAVPHHWSDQRRAWPGTVQNELPGPVGVYTAVVLVLAAMTTGAVVIGRRWGSRRQPRGMASGQQLAKALTA